MVYDSSYLGKKPYFGMDNQFMQGYMDNRKAQMVTNPTYTAPPAKPDSFVNTKKVTKANDGKFSITEAAKNFGKGIISPITSMFSSWKGFAVGAAMIVGGIALTAATGPAILPAFVALGVGTGVFQGGAGLLKLFKAKNGDDAEKAFFDFGAATSYIGMSAGFAKPSLKGSGLVSEAELGQTKWYSAVVKSFELIPDSLKTSFTAIKEGKEAGKAAAAVVTAERVSKLGLVEKHYTNVDAIDARYAEVGKELDALHERTGWPKNEDGTLRNISDEEFSEYCSRLSEKDFAHRGRLIRENDALVTKREEILGETETSEEPINTEGDETLQDVTDDSFIDETEVNSNSGISNEVRPKPFYELAQEIDAVFKNSNSWSKGIDSCKYDLPVRLAGKFGHTEEEAILEMLKKTKQAQVDHIVGGDCPISLENFQKVEKILLKEAKARGINTENIEHQGSASQSTEYMEGLTANKDNSTATNLVDENVVVVEEADSKILPKKQNVIEDAEFTNITSGNSSDAASVVEQAQSKSVVNEKVTSNIVEEEAPIELVSRGEQIKEHHKVQEYNHKIWKATEAEEQGTLNETQKELLAKIDSDFDNLKPSEKEYTFYRGLCENPLFEDRNRAINIIDQANVGDFITPEKHCPYTGYTKKLASNWSGSSGGRTVMMEIRTPKGAKISCNLEHGGEGLFPRNAQYKLISKTKDENGFIYAVLEYQPKVKEAPVISTLEEKPSISQTQHDTVAENTETTTKSTNQKRNKTKQKPEKSPEELENERIERELKEQRAAATILNDLQQRHHTGDTTGGHPHTESPHGKPHETGHTADDVINTAHTADDTAHHNQDSNFDPKINLTDPTIDLTDGNHTKINLGDPRGLDTQTLKDYLNDGHHDGITIEDLTQNSSDGIAHQDEAFKFPWDKTDGTDLNHTDSGINHWETTNESGLHHTDDFNLHTDGTGFNSGYNPLSNDLLNNNEIGGSFNNNFGNNDYLNPPDLGIHNDPNDPFHLL